MANGYIVVNIPMPAIINKPIPKCDYTVVPLPPDPDS